MTPEELELLTSISAKNVETFFPAGRSAAQGQAFDELVERLQSMERLRWIEMKAAEQPAGSENTSAVATFSCLPRLSLPGSPG